MYKKKKNGFTLAEVLITLGIIGVVAAMTIPTLMSSYRKKVIETRLSKFYSTINQALKLAEADYDDRSGWDELGNGYIEDENGDSVPAAESWVKKYLVPYIKADTKIKNTHGKIELYFQDGSVVIISSSSWLYYPDAKKYKLLEDEKIDQHTAAGKYMFIFLYGGQHQHEDSNYKYTGNGVEPYRYAWNGTREDLFNGSYGCGKSGVIGAYCTELIRSNNWKFPSDYPIKI